MQRFALYIDLENDALSGGDSAAREVARILRDTAERLEGGEALESGTGTLRDFNGNAVGRAAVEGVGSPRRGR